MCCYLFDELIGSSRRREYMDWLYGLVFNHVVNIYDRLRYQEIVIGLR